MIGPARIRGAGGVLAFALCAGASPLAFAQAAAAPSAPSPPGQARTAEVVVTPERERPQPGAVVGDIKPELQLNPAEIQAYGVNNLSQLIDELSPQTRSDRGRGGEPPAILLNGRRISGFAELRDLPTEVILRVDILPEEVALKYGFPASQKVINIVLRPFFRALTAEVEGAAPTAGGQIIGQAETALFRIRRDHRLSVDLKVQGQSAITEDERHLVSRDAGQLFDPAGNVIPAPPAQSLAGLSDGAGRPVTVAGVPSLAGAGQPLSLADFASTAGAPNVSDVGRYRTLKPSSREATLNAVYSRPLSGGISATLNGTLGATHSESLQGLPGVVLAVPAGDPYSPFAAPVLVERGVTAFGPLRQTTDGWTAHLGTTLFREFGRWRVTGTGAYDHADSITHVDRGLDAGLLNARLAADDAGLDPFAPIPENLLVVRPQDKARSQTDALDLNALAMGPSLHLPAGDVLTVARVGFAQTWISSRSQRFGAFQSLDLSRADASAHVNADLPVTSRKAGVLGALGDLTLNANAKFDHLSDFGDLTAIGYGAHWTPMTPLSINISHTREEAAPSLAQLGGAVIVTPGVQTFDFVTGQTAQIRQITGGAPDLKSDVRNVFSVGLNYKPFPERDLYLTAKYVHSRIQNAVKTFPAVTAAIEQAFPDRFVRDAEGRLTQVDLRPVNFASETTSELRWGVNFMKRLGPAFPTRFRRPDGAPPPDGPGAPGGEGPRAFGGGPRGPFGGPRPGAGAIVLSIYHTVHFQDEDLVRPGGPKLDLLRGSPGAGTAQPRHEIEAQGVYSLSGYGARLSAKWNSATVVHAAPGAAVSDLAFSDLLKVDLRLFADLSARRELVSQHPFLRGSRVSFAVTNLFDARQKVRDGAGATPLPYQAAYLDPVGRTVKVEFRKLFF